MSGEENYNQVNQYVYKDGKKLRFGYTTGTCAAAAAKAAVKYLLEGICPETVRIMTPKGIRLLLDVQQAEAACSWAQCGIQKDAGDDPDVTDKIVIVARAEILDRVWTEGVYLSEGKVTVCLAGGLGIGRVTKRGLSCPPGLPAINPVPREMLFQAIRAVCDSQRFAGIIGITLKAPGGEQIAEKTFNSRLGIIGGISIIGTTGIVEPMSEAALVESIKLEMSQQKQEGRKLLLMTPGNYGHDFAKQQLHLNMERGIKCSNFIGEAIACGRELGIARILLIGHLGKLVKLAAGMFQTHSRYGDARMEILAAHAILAGAKRETAIQILECVATEEACQIMKAEGVLTAAMGLIMEKIESQLRRRAGATLTVECILFTNELGVLGHTKEAYLYAREWTKQEKRL